MGIVVAVASSLLIVLILQDSFEAMLLPRRVPRNYQFARLFYRNAWRPWATAVRRLRSPKRRNTLLSFYGPLAMLVLFALWAVGLIVGFALLQWSLGSPLGAAEETTGIGTYLYLSGVTFFTLGFGDVTPLGSLGRFLAVLETGLGFGFLAVVISYMPVLYQAFSSREHTISLLDARAGSPPTAAQLLLRLAPSPDFAILGRFLEEWERWAAAVLESHITFPMLSYYRSQHDNQSWLGALTTILDTCALVLAGVRGADLYQAQLTFAMARHAAVDLAQTLQTRPQAAEHDRLPPDRLRRLRQELRQAGFDLRESEADEDKLRELRGMYEPFVIALAAYLVLPLPEVIAESGSVDNWQTSAWMRRTGGLGTLAALDPGDDHAEE